MVSATNIFFPVHNRRMEIFPNRMVVALLLPFLIFVFYQFFVDIFITNNLVEAFINTFKSFYIKELYLISLRIQIYGLSFGELLAIAFSTYTKYITLLAITITASIFSLIIFLAKKEFLPLKKRLSSLVTSLLSMLSISIWFLAYAGTGGEFLQGGRVVPIIQFLSVVSLLLLTENFIMCYKRRPTGKFTNNLMLLTLMALILFNVIANYGLQPLSPNIKVGNYTLETSVANGPVSDYVLSAIMFVDTHANSITLTGFEPYTTFAYMDLVRSVKNKVLITSENFITESDVIDSLHKYLESNRNVVLPMTSYDNVVPGKLGYKGFYTEPTSYLINRYDFIYSNKFYMLFYS
jgi:hypothetical protein